METKKKQPRDEEGELVSRVIFSFLNQVIPGLSWTIMDFSALRINTFPHCLNHLGLRFCWLQ